MGAMLVMETMPDFLPGIAAVNAPPDSSRADLAGAFGLHHKINIFVVMKSPVTTRVAVPVPVLVTVPA